MPIAKCLFWSLPVLLTIMGQGDNPIFAASCRENWDSPRERLSPREPAARPHLADYDAELRRKDGRVDADAMVRRLKELGVTTYYWLICHAPTDWDDLKVFLPKAAKAGIEVWVYLVPPSESAPSPGMPHCEPFRLDYVRWGEEIARLSLAHPNLTAWVIDDFYANRRFFTPAYVGEMRTKSRAINPRLAFLPLMYFPEISEKFVKDYRPVIDGAVVAYLQDREEIDRTWAMLNDASIPPVSELSCPAVTPTRAGDYVMASQSAKVLPAERYQLSFLERDGYTGPTTGYHYKQLLVDGGVVWEEDAAGGPSGWQRVSVDVTRQVRGKTNVSLAFRLLEKKGVGNFPLQWRVKQLRGQNLQLAADLSEPQNWKASHRGPLETEFGASPKPGRRRFHIPFISMTAAQPVEFRLRHGDPASPERIAQQLRISLEAWRAGKCDGVVTYCLDKRPQSPEFPLVRKLFAEFAGSGP